ncbi:MAG: amidohydrolase family protein [Leptospiraceae bacterium]|nr:amidohydrolase family protein [Leptospiraceae bacterium]
MIYIEQVNFCIVSTPDGRNAINIFEVYRGQWALTQEGTFRQDPWFIVAGSQVLDMGFGRPPQDFFVKSLPEGVIVPGLVNAHTHLELSVLNKKIPEGCGLAGMAEAISSERTLLSSATARRAAIEQIANAFQEGTWFYNDISNNAEFTGFLRSVPEFAGNRFLELLGFQSPNDEQRMQIGKELIESDHEVILTPHSVYGSSPAIMRFVNEYKRRSLLSIHLLESMEEHDLPHERGEIWEFLKKIGQAYRHTEIRQKNLLEYLYLQGIFSYKKLLLVHLSSAYPSEIDYLSEVVPHAAWVLCQRSNEHLHIQRKNWQALLNSPLTMLIGTDSAATSPDVSVLKEMYQIMKQGQVSESRIWQAATFSAYDYLEISQSHVPYFLYPEARPTLESIASHAKAIILRG